MLVSALSALATVNAYAADDPFVGTWKLNLNKTQFTGQVVEIKDLAAANTTGYTPTSTPNTSPMAKNTHSSPAPHIHSARSRRTDGFSLTSRTDR